MDLSHLLPCQDLNFSFGPLLLYSFMHLHPVEKHKQIESNLIPKCTAQIIKPLLLNSEIQQMFRNAHTKW